MQEVPSPLLFLKMEAVSHESISLIFGPKEADEKRKDEV